MGLWVAVAAAVVLASGGKPVPDGCEKRCEKQYVPCRDARVEDQMMCVEVVRRCEIRCPGQASSAQASAPKQSR